MKFKIDENLPIEVADLLSQAGYDAAAVIEQALGGHPDGDIAAVCQREQRALVTIDTDFADIRAYPPRLYAGLIVLRLKQQDKPTVLQLIAKILPTLASEPLAGQLWIVEERRIRIRT
jgi:predicted nuclease of predicted toxin-antitoxin system